MAIYISPNQIPDHHPAFTRSSVRTLIARAADNGLAPAIHRRGRKVLIDLTRFDEWVEHGEIQPDDTADAA